MSFGSQDHPRPFCCYKFLSELPSHLHNTKGCPGQAGEDGTMQVWVGAGGHPVSTGPNKDGQEIRTGLRTPGWQGLSRRAWRSQVGGRASATNRWRCTYNPHWSSGHCKVIPLPVSWRWRDMVGTQLAHSSALGAARGPQDCAEDPRAGEGAGAEPCGWQHGWLGRMEAGGMMPVPSSEMWRAMWRPLCPPASRAMWGAGCWWKARPEWSPGSVRAPLPAGMAVLCLRRVKEAEDAGSGPSRSP